MSGLVHIFLSVIFPMFFIMGIGCLVDRFFKFHLPTLARLNFYIFVPALIFIKLLEADLAPSRMLGISLFTIVHVAILFVLSWVLFRRGPLARHETIGRMGTMFFNAGNYGIPLIALAFGDEYISVIAIIIMVQNFLVFSVGIWLLERKTDGGSCFLTGVLKVPTIYAIVAALALRLILRPYNLELPPQLMQPLNYLAGGLIPIALLTLGIQLGRTRMTSNLLPISVIAVLRLAVSPILAVLLVYIFRFEGTIASILIVAAGLPVAVNVFILSAQYKHDEQFASQAVFWTTLLSGVTISILLSFFA